MNNDDIISIIPNNMPKIFINILSISHIDLNIIIIPVIINQAVLKRIPSE